MKKSGKTSKVFLKENNRGLSTIVLTLIIILVSIVAVGIVWTVVRNILNTGSNQIGINKFTVDLSINGVYEQAGNLSVSVKRNSGQGEITKIKFILFDGKNSETITRDSDINELEIRIFSFHPNTLILDEIIEISVAPVFIADNGIETTGTSTDTYDLGGGIGGGESICGDGIIETGESCDAGNFGGLSCSSFGFAGGGNLTCSNCEIDTSQCIGGTGGTCGDNVINPGEECDNANFGGLSCLNFGFIGGDLNCILCSISTYGCVSQGCIPDCAGRVCGPDPVCGLSCGPCGSPNSCSNGVCVPPACVPESNATTCGAAVCGTKVNNCGTLVFCGPLNGNCLSGQLCESGNCVLPLPVNTGLIQETWPGTSGLFFGSSNLSTTTDYQGYYVKFPSKPTISCRIILHYKFPVTGYAKSYIELAFETPIVSGDSYAVFETSEKCSLY